MKTIARDYSGLMMALTLALTAMLPARRELPRSSIQSLSRLRKRTSELCGIQLARRCRRSQQTWTFPHPRRRSPPSTAFRLAAIRQTGGD